MDGAVAAEGGRAAFGVSYNGSDPDEVNVYIQDYNTWLQPVYDAVRVTPPGLLYAYHTVTGRQGPYTWVAWYEGSAGVFAAMCDETGELGAPRFQVFSGLHVDDSGLRLDINGERVAIGAQVWVGNQVDQYLRVYPVDAEAPLSGQIPVATTSQDEMYSDISVATDGSVVFVYGRGNHYTHIFYAYFQRVRPDFVVEAPVLITAQRAQPFGVRAQADGSVLVFSRSNPTGTWAYVQRFDLLGQPLGDPIAVDPGGFRAAATRDGRFAIYGYGPSTYWLRLYDASGVPLHDAWNFADNAGYGMPRPSNFPIAYDDDGTVWLSWWGGDAQAHTVWLLTSLKPLVRGDLNGDGLVNNQDIDLFIEALFDAAGFEQHHPGVPYHILGDFTGDNLLNNQDINGFVAALFGG